MSNFRQVVETGSTAAIAIVAVVVGLTYLHDRRLAAKSQEAEASARIIPDWESENARGIWKGSANASIVITEFMDFQCPFCAALAPKLDSILEAHPQKIAVVFQHFPLPSHQYAIPAAVASECADRQGRFWPMYRSLLNGQRKYGSVEWEAFAEEAGVPDQDAFAACILLPPDSFPRINHGIEVGQRAGVRATPTIWVNGRVTSPTDEALGKLLN